MRRSLVAVLLPSLAFAVGLTACGDDDSSGTAHIGMMDGHDESTPVAEGARRIEVP